MCDQHALPYMHMHMHMCMHMCMCMHMYVLCTHMDMEIRQNHSSIAQHAAETRLYTTGDAVGSGYIRTFPGTGHLR